MKRLNPATGLPFKFGDIREDGYFFNSYRILGPRRKDGTFFELWNKKHPTIRSNERYTTEEGRTYKLINRAKKRAIEKNMKFDISFDKIKKALDTGICELTGLPFDFNSTKKTQYNPYGPSIDRIDSQKGYVDCNIRVVLSAVNTALGQYGTDIMLPILKEMVKAIEKNAKQNTAAPVSEGTYIQGAVGAELGSVSTPWAWEDYDHTDDHSGAVRGQDADHRAQTSSGDGLGRGGTEVVTPEPLTRIEDHGQPDAEIIRLDFGGRHIPD